MLSTIITTYNQTAIALAHIKKCMECSVVPDEIVVINDGGEDFLEEIKKLDRNTTIIYARITEDKKWNQNGARNLGIYLSRGDILSFEDNDHLPFPNYYEQGLELLKMYDGVVVKKRHVIESPEKLETIKTRGMATIITMRKRDDVLKCKGFDEQFVGSYGWDVPDFINRIGGNIIANGDFWVVSSMSSTENRTFWGNGTTKMAPVNYHHYKRNIRNKNIQSPIGILNFNFNYEKIYPNIH